MPLQIIRNDITRIKADAIVNTANPHAAVGTGVDSAIYKKAGYRKLLAERAKIGEIRPGQAAVTPAFALDAKYVIHTVGPVWKGGTCGEREIVRDCYFNSLQLARKNGCASIAFPLISTGAYGFPKGEALQLAVSVIREFLQEEEMEVFLVVFDQESFVLSGRFFENIAAYIDEKYVDMHTQSEYGDAERARRRRIEDDSPDSTTLLDSTFLSDDSKSLSEDSSGTGNRERKALFSSARQRKHEKTGKQLGSGAPRFLRRAPEPSPQEESAARLQEAAAARTQEEAAAQLQEEAAARSQEETAAQVQKEAAAQAQKEAAAQPQRVAESICYGAEPEAVGHNLEDAIKEIGESFQKRLLRLIDEKQMSDVEIYKRANLDRKLFSKIRCNADYKPQKKTAVALAIALELNLDDTKDLLARAGLALSPCSRFDLIVSYFIENEVYDIYAINLALFQYSEQTLG